MATIGEDIMTILGMIPMRDRAGIQRGNLAQLAAQSEAAATQQDNPNANGRALMAPGLPGAPPAVMSPPGMGPRPMTPPRLPVPPQDPETTGSVVPSQSRVVASAPVGAPNQLDAQLAEHRRQQMLGGLLDSVGAIGAGFSRNPQTQAAGRQMAASAGSGGGGDSVSEVLAIHAAREKMAAAAVEAQRREQGIATLQRLNGYDKDYATLIYDQKKADAVVDPANVAKREEEKRAAQVRMELLRPENIAEIAKRTGMPPAVIKADINSGKLGQKEIADILSTQSQTTERDQKTSITGADFGVRSEGMKNPDAIAARLSQRLGRAVDPDEVQLAAASEETWKTFIKETTQGGQATIGGTIATSEKNKADTAEQLRKTEEERKSTTAYNFYKDNPDAFARLHDIQLDEARRIVSNPDNFKKYQETSGPTAYADEAAYAAARREGYKGTREDWKKIRPGAETIDEYRAKKAADADIEGDRKARDEYFKENKDAREAYDNLSTIRRTQQDLYDDDMYTGMGKFSFAELQARKVFAKVTGRPDANIATTQAFNAYRNQVVVQISKDLKGATTEGDRELLEKAAGGMEMSAAELRRFVILQDIADQRRIASKRQSAEGFRESDPKRHAQMLHGVPDYPPPNRLIREDMAAKPGLVKLVRESPDKEMDFPVLDQNGDPVKGKNGKPKVETMTVKDYAEKTWGPGGYEHIRRSKKD